MLAVSSVGLAAGGHLLGGGHVEPLFLLLLLAAATLTGHTWLSKERGMLAIAGAVVTVQVGVHLGLTLGHDHALSAAMVLTHAGAALLLAVFLRTGEARIYAAARRRLLNLLVAMRLLTAGLPQYLPMSLARWEGPCCSLTPWTPAPGQRRGPPVAATA